MHAVRSEIPDLVTALDSHSIEFGPDHPGTLAVANNLAIALWIAGDVSQAVGLLDHSLEICGATLGRAHPVRLELLRTLGEILMEEARAEQACTIYRELLALCLEHFGENHPCSVAAKGDLAAVLFDLGQIEEATQFEREACESAQIHLGKAHSVSCVLAWNRALRLEEDGHAPFARIIIAEELSWLLTENESRLEPDQQIIRAILAERLSAGSSKVC